MNCGQERHRKVGVDHERRNVLAEISWVNRRESSVVNIARKTCVGAFVVCLLSSPGCHLWLNRSDDFSALTTPISYRVPSKDNEKQAPGVGEKAIGKLKDATVFVGKGVMLVGGFVFYVWLNDDDETPLEKQSRLGNERAWKRYWRNNPDKNPAMTEAFKDDYK